MKQFYAVFDTNVLVSALMSARLESPSLSTQTYRCVTCRHDKNCR